MTQISVTLLVFLTILTIELTPKWACAQCGRPFTRAWNAQRHISNTHAGRGDIVSFMGYLAGVNSGKYRRPSYAYFKPKPLEHSSLSGAEIRVGFHDLQNAGWPARLKSMLESEIFPSVLASEYKKALRLRGENYYYIKYCGYVCGRCLSIGAHINGNTAQAFSNGSHKCGIEAIYAPVHLNDVDRNTIVDSLFDKELPTLLSTIVKTFCKSGKFMLVIEDADVQRPPSVIDMHIFDLWSFVRAAMHSAIEISEDELTQILFRAKSTFGSVVNEEGLSRDIKNACIAIKLA